MVSGCPRCAHPLIDVRRDALHVFACTSCAGVWLGGTTLDQFARALRDRPEAHAAVDRVTTDALLDFSVDPSPVSCPVCDETMEAMQNGEGITLDVCRSHGVWFDRDELTRVLSGPDGAASAMAARDRVHGTSSADDGMLSSALWIPLDAAHAVATTTSDAADLLDLAHASVGLAASTIEVLGSLAAGAVGLVFEVLSLLDPT